MGSERERSLSYIVLVAFGAGFILLGYLGDDVPRMLLGIYFTMAATRGGRRDQ